LIGAFAYLFLITLDILPRLFPDIFILFILEPVIPLLGSLTIVAIASWLLSKLWSKRDEMKSKFGDRSYQMMIPSGMIGVALVIPTALHVYTSVRSLPPNAPVNELTINFSKSLLSFLGVATELDVGIRVVLSGIFLILALLVVRSSVLTFGVDYMTVVYLYFPEESELQEHEIYSIIRHPTYMAAILIGFAGLLFRFSVYSILLFAIFYLIFILQIRREEKELIERFGDGYREYMESVPALHVRPGDLKKFVRFLRV